MVSKYDRGFDDIQVLILAILLFENFIKINGKQICQKISEYLGEYYSNMALSVAHGPC